MLTLPQVSIDSPPIDWTDLPKRFMNNGELEALCALIGSIQPKIVIEFGINTGRTAKAILREVPGINHYIGVDVLPGYTTAMRVQRKEIPEQAGEMVIGDKRVSLLVREHGSYDLTDNDIPELDVAFIDGDHSYRGVQNDTNLVLPKVRKGGLIIWHDYHDMGTVEVREFLHDRQKKGHEIFHITGTWLAYEIVK